jgi:Fic family protein
MINKHFSHKISVFHGRTAPEEGTLAGYGAIVETFNLPVPIPEKLVLISAKNRQYITSQWLVLTLRHKPKESLYKQLVFAIKYEGINLLIIKKLFEVLQEKEILEILQQEPLGQYSRKIWFLYEWLLSKELSIPNIQSGNYVSLIDEKLQICLPDGIKSSRHRIINNLPGTRDFCPLIHKTEKIQKYISTDLAQKNNKYIKKLRKDIFQRASAFLLLKDSRASFIIEGESPKSKRAARWGQTIGQAGTRGMTIDELLRLQQMVIENKRFTKMGFRKQGGFVGEHDRVTGEPIPDHISAHWKDIEQLINGLIETNDLLINNEFDPVLAAAIIAFGFVVIHPFVDGNGRIHRYLIHHVLAKKNFSHQGIVFPVSASILDHINDYRAVLESYSHPLLDLVEWQETPDHNVEVLNETIDYYRYFDATKFAEFLFDRVNDTIENIIPEEISYLRKYDEFKHFADNDFEMPDKIVADLVRYLEQNNGKLSKIKRENYFPELTDYEVKQIEKRFNVIFKI